MSLEAIPVEAVLDKRWEDAQTWFSLGVTAHKAWESHMKATVPVDAAKVAACIDLT